MLSKKLFLSALLTTTVSLFGCSEIFLASDSINAQAIEDNGDFLIEYVPPQDETHTEISQIIQESQFYDELVDWLNETYALPEDILISFEECGESNAFYDPSEIKISMCYELIHQYATIFGEEANSDEEYADEIIYAGYFTFLHELGHALIDQYELPVVGREEDAVDSLAAVLLVDWEEEDAAIAGIDQFSVDAEEEEELEEIPYWDEHSLSLQRYYNIACLLYGSDPEEYEDWVGEDDLPEDRAEMCEEEYEQAATSWEALLAPYEK